MKKLLLIIFLFFTLATSWARIYFGAALDDIKTSYPEGEKTLLTSFKKGDEVTGLIYSDETRTLYTSIKNGAKQFVLTNNKKSPSYDGIYNFGFLTSIKKIFYYAEKKDKTFIIVNDKVLGPYERIGDFSSSFKDDYMAFQIGEGDKVAMIINGVREKNYDEIGSPSLSLNGHYAYSALEEGQNLLVIDGKENRDYQNYGLYFYSGEADELYYTAQNEQGWFIIHNTEVVAGPYEEIDLLKVASNGNGYIATAKQNNKRFALVNNVEQPAYDQIFNINISDDGKSFSYGIIEDNLGAYVINGETGSFYDDLFTLSFISPSNRYLYWAKKEGRWTLIDNGKETISYQKVLSDVEFSDDGQILCFWIEVNGKTILVIQKDQQIRYYRDIISYNLDNNKLSLLVEEQNKIYSIQPRGF